MSIYFFVSYVCVNYSKNSLKKYLLLFLLQQGNATIIFLFAKFCINYYFIKKNIKFTNRKAPDIF